VYKVLYTDEVMRCVQSKPTTDMKLGYKIDIPPTSYDQYKNKNQERAISQAPKEEAKQSYSDQMNETAQST